MCDCGCSRPGKPSTSGVASCPFSKSEILIIDELGVPLANVAVKITIGGTTHNISTDADGKVCLKDPPGTSVEIEIPDMHEANKADSTTTASGKHFSTLGTGP